MQVGQTGSDRQVKAVGQILSETRRRIYLVLADGGDGEPASEEQAATDGSAPAPKSWRRSGVQPLTRIARVSGARWRRGWVPVVDHARCEGKRDCLDVCPNDVFEVRRIDDSDFRALGRMGRLKVRAHRMATAYTPNADDCRACGLCVVACPEDAIVLTRPG